MKGFKRGLSLTLTIVMLLSSLSVNMTVNADEASEVIEEDVVIAETAVQREDDEIIDTELPEAPSTVTEKGMQFKIDNLQDVKSIRYAYGEYDTEKDIKYGADSVSHSAKNLRKRGDSCVLQFPKAGLVSIVVTYNDGTRDFYKYDVIKNSPTVTRDGGNSITFGNLSDLKVLRYVKGEYESSYDIKRANGSVAVSGKTLNSDTYTVALDRETYTFCVQYNDESYNYYVTGVCGDNLTWVYDMQTCTLTISGEGEMDEYYYKDIPWYDYKMSIKTATLESGITKISREAFYECSSLVNVTLPSTLEIIDYCAFECTALTSIVIPENVRIIKSSAFKKCENLESVILGNGVEEIYNSVFEKCLNLKNVVFGNNIKLIGWESFLDCTSLNDIDLPDSVVEIDAYAFSGTGYYNNQDNWENKLLYLEEFLIDTKSYLGTCIIRDGIKTIASCAFEYAFADYIYIPESVVHIVHGGLDVWNFGITSIYDDVVFMVVKGSYAEQYIIEHTEYSYRYYEPSDIYG